MMPRSVGHPVGPDLAMVRGDTPTWRFHFSRAGQPVVLTDALIFFTAKRDLGDADVAAVFQKKFPGGGIVLGPLGQAEVSLAIADTASLLDRDYTLHYDVQLKETGGGVTSFRGKLFVACDVTEATT